MRVSFNWLKDYVDIRVAAEAVAEKLTMVGLEVTSLTRLDGDVIMEIEVTPNRPDCLSIVGVAREVAAAFGRRLKLPRISSFRGVGRVCIPIQIQDKQLCPRYLGRVIKNVRVGPSPEWLIQRLEVMGIRAVNNIVDITNFCLLEFGQPLHAFDLDRLQGPKIVVRRAQKQEEIVTIDGVRRKLEPDMLVIADKLAPVAIAGIMGGKESEVKEATTNILLESAYFAPQNIHHTSRKLGLATQSSYRFERGVDFAGVHLASLRATELIARFASAQRKRKAKAMAIGRLVEKGKKAVPTKRVLLRVKRVREVLGVPIHPAQIKEILHRLDFSLMRKSAQSLTVSVPTFRQDIAREADLLEEIARLFGYEQIPLCISRLIPNLSYAGSSQLFAEEVYALIRQILASLGLHEIITYSLISRQGLRRLELSEENIITVKNPLSYEQEILRPSLLAGMLNAVLTNMHRHSKGIKLFELSRVYIRTASNEIQECTHLCIGMAGRKDRCWFTPQEQFNFFHLKGVVETLLHRLGVEGFHFSAMEQPIFTAGRCAQLLLGAQSCGFLGELKQQILERYDLAGPIYVSEIELDKLLAHIHLEKRFSPLARFPAIERDISLLAPQDVTAEQITSLIKRIGGELITRVMLIDQYLGEQIPSGFRGLTFSIEYRSPERTLNAQEVDKLQQKVHQALGEELRVELR